MVHQRRELVMCPRQYQEQLHPNSEFTLPGKIFPLRSVCPCAR